MHKLFKKQMFSNSMQTKLQIAPSLLAVDYISQLEAKIRELDAAGADLFHIDVMDGIFVSQRSPYLDVNITEAIRGFTTKPIDVHLMVKNPDEYIGRFIDAGANIVTIHAEAEGDKIPTLLKQHFLR